MMSAMFEGDAYNPVVFLLGSNSGDRKDFLLRACDMLEKEIYFSALIEQRWARSVPFDMGIHVSRPRVWKSSIREYPAWPEGSGLQPFLNMALVLLSDKSPQELLTIAKNTEQNLGRDLTLPLYDEHGERIYRPRTIDIDIIFYGGLIYRSEDLVIPHPLYRERRFVLEPIAEAVPEYIDPVTGKSVRQLLNELK